MDFFVKFLRKRLRIFKKLYFEIFDLLNPKLEVDRDLLEKTIENFHLDETTSQIKEFYGKLAFKEGENAGYFKNILNYINAGNYLPNNPFFIYPPNAAAIDFLLKNASKSSFILDYGCGLGNIIIYLRKIGFKETFGYDNFSQIKKETVIEALKNFGVQDAILSKDKVLRSKTNVALCFGYFWQKLEKEILLKEAGNDGIEYILLDYHYAPRIIKNFKIAGIYKNLLVVFERK